MLGCNKSTIFAADHSDTNLIQHMHFANGIKIGYLILFSILVSTLDVSAQAEKASVSAVVVDETSGDPIGFASAALLVQGSNAYVKGMQTVDDGKVVFTDIAPGRYALRITYVGYEDHLTENVVVEAGKTVNLGSILLKRAGELLEEVVVEGAPPAMELGIDRKIFNVAESTLSVGGTATDLLANVPS